MGIKYKIVNKKRFAVAVTAFAITFTSLGVGIHDIVIDGVKFVSTKLINAYEKEMAYNEAVTQNFIKDTNSNEIHTQGEWEAILNEEKSK